MIKATELTPKSWLLTKSAIKLGLLREIPNNGYAIIGGPYPGEYSSLEDLEKSIGNTIKFHKPIKEEKEQREPAFLNGIPIKHDNIFPVEYDNELIHAYAKKEGSDDLFAAGYFAIEFSGRWSGSYCPRLKPMEEHKWIGPFKTKLECDHTIRVENNK